MAFIVVKALPLLRIKDLDQRAQKALLPRAESREVSFYARAYLAG
jgi:hypothetical protein